MPIRASRNESPLLVSLPAPFTRDSLARATQVLFETTNCPSLSITEEALLSMYAAGSTQGITVDIGWSSCAITPISDTAGVLTHAITRSGVGMRHVALWLAHLLAKDESVVHALAALAGSQGSSEEQLALMLFKLATLLISEGHVRAKTEGGHDGDRRDKDGREEEAEFDVAAALVAGRERAAIEEQERKNKAALEGAGRSSAEGQAAKVTTQKGATDEEGAVETTFEGIRFRIHPSPLSQACDPLWDPTVLLSLKGTLAEAAIRSLGVEDLGSQVKLAEDWSTCQSVQDAAFASVDQVTEASSRPALWENVIVTGAPVRLVPNLTQAVNQACTSLLASSAAAAAASGGVTGDSTPIAPGPGGVILGGSGRDSPNLMSMASRDAGYEGVAQPTNVRTLRVPDYFAEYKDRNDLAPFLGATIYAKVSISSSDSHLQCIDFLLTIESLSTQLAFSDPYGRNTVSKAVYNERGPGMSFAVPALSS